jgi:hypothetical protein
MAPFYFSSFQLDRDDRSGSSWNGDYPIETGSLGAELEDIEEAEGIPDGMDQVLGMNLSFSKG